LPTLSCLGSSAAPLMLIPLAASAVTLPMLNVPCCNSGPREVNDPPTMTMLVGRRAQGTGHCGTSAPWYLSQKPLSSITASSVAAPSASARQLARSRWPDLSRLRHVLPSPVQPDGQQDSCTGGFLNKSNEQRISCDSRMASTGRCRGIHPRQRLTSSRLGRSDHLTQDLLHFIEGEGSQGLRAHIAA
jgi:hypothetical protein